MLPPSREQQPQTPSRKHRWMPLATALFLVACRIEVSERTEVSGHNGDCASCHADEWSLTRAPSHSEAKFSDQCGDCHGSSAWRPALAYDHVKSFPLTLGHSALDCASCHSQGFAPGKTKSDCASCHTAEAEAVVDPVHAGLTNDCFACHRTDSFFPAHFVHSWPLRGKHTLTSCRACHQSQAGPPVYERASSACVSCHTHDQTRADTALPEHAGYSAQCEQCHGFDRF